MQRIIIDLPEALVTKLRFLLKQDRRPEAEIIREALGAYLAGRGISCLPGSDAVSNRSVDVTEDDQYFADLAEPYR